MATILEALLICRPISAAWDQNTRGSCGNDVAAYIVFEISGLIIDLAIGTWLIPLDLRLQMNKRRKIQVILIRSTGLFTNNLEFRAILINALRIKALHFVNSVDFTYSKCYIGLLSALWALISIILCCTPAIPILIKRRLKPSSPIASPKEKSLSELDQLLEDDPPPPYREDEDEMSVIDQGMVDRKRE
ncbi:hypothetical protein MMC14_007006 [Varicellaria rhodocarpa]|nr:hypothetical protein [Varicellaria rhodocarpa]